MNQPFTLAILSATFKKNIESGKGNFAMLQSLITCLLFLIAAQAFGQVSQTFTSTSTYTVPAGVTQLVVECWGGGGAGGGATGNPAAGGGGAGGAYVKSTVTVTPGTTYTVTVGGIKTATTTSTAATNKGNPSWFGSTSTIFAEGGNGGAPATANSTNGAGGTGTTTASIGTLKYAGGNAAAGNFTSNVIGGAGAGGAGSTGVGGNAAAGVGGTGSTLNGGNGANGVANSTPGAAGANYGGGGSGGKANTGTDVAGGSGAAGLVVVTIPAPANDNCSGATALTLGGATVTGDINYSSTSLAACTGADAYDVWYSFTTTCSGNHTITVDPSNSFNAVVQLYNACGGTVVTPNSGGSCVNAGGDNVNETPTYNLASGTTYYVRVYDYNLTAAGYPATTTFTIAVSAPALPTTSNAGPDQTGSATCGLTALTLGANNPTSGTGAWSIVSGTGGSFVNASSFNSIFNGTLGSTYTLRWTISTSGCTPSTDDVTVAFNINPTANAGPDQTSSATCGLTSVTLAGSMNAGTGTWSVISGTGGSFSNTSSPTSTFTGTAGSTYTLRWTVTNSPCTQTATDDVVITFNTNPVLTITNPAAVCSNSAGANLTAATVTTGSTGSGTLSYWTNALATNALSSPSAVTTSGTYYIRSLTSAGCVDIEPVTVTITPLPVATFSYTGSPYCSNATNPLPTFSGGGVAGTFSSTAGLTFVSATTGQINLSATTAGTYTVTNTIAAAGGCPAVTATSTVTETTAPSATISYAGSPFCRTTASGAVTRTGTAGGTYTASPAGLTINASTGAITPTTSTAGTYTVTYTVAASGGCAAFTTTASVTITALPVATFSYTGTPYCSNATNPLPTFSGGGVAGTFSSTAGLTFVSATTGQINLSASTAGTYTVTNTIAAAGGCPAVTATSTVTETTAPSATISYAGSPFCRTTASGAVTRTGTAGGTYTASPAGLTINASTGAITPTTSTPGVYTVTYTVAASGGCAAFTTTASVTITALPVATFSYTGTPYCSNTTNPLPTFSGGGVAGIFSSTAGLAFVSATTGQINLAATTSGTYTVTNTIVAAGGCPAVTATSTVTETNAPSAIISFTDSVYCRSVASANITLTGIAGGTFSAPAGLTINATTGTITPSASVAGTYTVTYNIAAAGGCAQFSTSTTTKIANLPVPVITANYCNPGAGQVSLTSSPATTYSWNTGATTQSILVNLANGYSVTVTNISGCSNTATINVAQELITNGDFDDGPVGFTSQYTNVQAFYTGGSTGLIPEATYAVGNNAHDYHYLFYGSDHTTGSGKYMIVNGSGGSLPRTIWQQTVSVQPNTTYYFSAWAMSVCSAPYAKLRFAIDNNQIGTISILTAGPNSLTAPNNWTQFYGTWTSGATATTITLTILDLELSTGGNDFGIDDISFSTLSPLAFNVVPDAGVGGNPECEGSPVTLYANRDGGMSPFTYSWTGPNGFTSNSENPLLTNAVTTSMVGTYTVSITDGNGCVTNNNFSLIVNTLPTNATVSAPTGVCNGVNTNVQILASQTGVSYQLRNNTNNALVGTAVNGTGGTINLPTGALTTATTFNILATNNTTGCSRVLSTTPTISILTTPNLNITNQAVCSGTVNLTAAAVTAGSTGGGTLTYWTNPAGTTAVTNPSAVAVSGVYYIRSTNGSCADIEAVYVSISSTPVTTFSYSGSPFCSMATDPSPTFSGGGIAGLFTSPTGAVFVDANTGQIDVSASPAGTHTITNTITPTGGCPAVSSSNTVVVTAMPSAQFNYPSTSLCQNANAADPLPVFSSGATAGTFSSSYGLSFTSTATGQIDISACVPGSYTVVNNIAATGGCPATSAATYIYINPYTFTGGVVASASPTTLCSGSPLNLNAQAPIYLSAAFREKFNSTTNNWVTTNTSTGGTPANAAFTLRPNSFVLDALTFKSRDTTQFYLTSSFSQGAGGTTSTTLRSPAFSTVGYVSLTLDFFHYFRAMNSGDVAKVQVSIDGFNWIDVATYTTTQGSSSSFSNPVIDLIDYINQPTLYIRFKYDATNDKYWAIDNVSVTGYYSSYTYSWASNPLGFASSLQSPVHYPTASATYNTIATNSYGCSATSPSVSTTVNPTPALSSTLSPTAICSNTAFTYTPTSTTTGTTFSWTRAAVAGISNAAVTTAQSANPSETLINTTTSPVNVVYAYTTSKNGCSATQNVTVKVNPPNVWNGSQSSNWFTGLNWCVNGNGIPTASTNALIPSVSITTRNPIIDNAQGTGAVAKNLQILSGGGLTTNGTAALTVWGTWNNSGTFTPNTGTVTFRGNVTDSIFGTDVQQFYNLTLDKGTDTTSVLKANVDINIANTLLLTNGLYNQNYGGGNITNALTISNKTGIDVTNNATLSTGASVTNSGLIRVTNGTIAIGGSSAHNLVSNAGGRLRVTTGNLAVAGNITNTSATARINGGIVEVGGAYIGTGTSSLIQTAGSITLNMNIASSNSNAIFDIAGTSTLNLTGGNIIVQDANGGTGGDIKITSGTGVKTINTSHTLQIGNSFTLASSIFKLNTGGTVLGKLWVFNSNGLVARLLANASANTLQLDRALDLNSNTFIVTNPATNSISGGGYVLAETTNTQSKLQWNVGNSIGAYIFPFGNVAGTAIPFTFNITSPGAQSTLGNITVTTYPTNDDNNPFVSGVTNVTMENGGNGALSTLDRWWVIDANNYAVKPISNMTFRYADVDLNGNPFLAENGLKAQRWDASLNNGLGGWNPPDFFGANTVNSAANTVTVNNVSNYSPWVLHDDLTAGNAPLPIELLSFAADCDNDRIRLSWETATEVNNDYFTIQRSLDLVSYTDIAVVSGSGSSNAINGYEAYDNEPLLGKTTYYRLVQTDFNGEFEMFAPVSVSCSSDFNDIITFYPNPAATILNVAMNVESEDTGAINIYNELGQLVKFLKVQSYAGSNNFTIDVSELPNGQYYVCFAMQNKRYPVQKLVVIR